MPNRLGIYITKQEKVMSLSCDCSYGDGDYDWYYDIPEQEYSANARGICYGCGDLILIGDEVRHISHTQYDEDGEPENEAHLGRICEKCSGHYDSLKELGYCLTADNGFIAEAMHEYRSMLPPSHILKTKQEK